jgi:hypothetical protein
MGDSKLLTEFREICEGHEADLAIDAIVEDFDTVYPVPQERLTRGIVISTGEKQRVVEFGRIKWPIANIGDRLVIVGRNKKDGRNSIRPIAILSPKEQRGSFSRMIPGKQYWKIIVPYVLSIAIATIFWLVARMTIPSFDIEIFMITWITTMITFQGSFWIYVRTPRSFNLDETTWVLLMEEIANRFDLKMYEWV